MEKKEQKDYSKFVKVLQIATGILMIVLVVAGIVVKQRLGISAKNIPLLSQQLTEQFGNGVLILSAIMIGISVVKSFAAHQSSISLSALNLSWHSRQSIRGSENPAKCPEATQVCGFISIAASSPTLYLFS